MKTFEQAMATHESAWPNQNANPDTMRLSINGSPDDLLWLRQRMHEMRHNYERQHNPKFAEIIARLTRLIDGMTIGNNVIGRMADLAPTEIK